jgi:uncharacterized protein with HEPN domain
MDGLCAIRDNIRLAQEWTANDTSETFTENQQLFYAVTRCLEIVSEASRRLPQELRDRHPELPWRAIADAGNVYRHAYDNVAEDAVWRTVQHSLPSLMAVVESEIANQPGGGLGDDAISGEMESLEMEDIKVSAAKPDPDEGLDIEP